MTDWTPVFLGIMAVSLAVMAAIQIGLIIVGVGVAKQATAAIADLRRELKPLSEKINRIAEDAAKASSLAALQVERLDHMIASTASRVDDTLGILQGLMSGPVQRGAAVVSVAKAVFSVIRDWKTRPRSSRAMRDEDDALFVG